MGKTQQARASRAAIDNTAAALDEATLAAARAMLAQQAGEPAPERGNTSPAPRAGLAPADNAAILAMLAEKRRKTQTPTGLFDVGHNAMGRIEGEGDAMVMHLTIPVGPAAVADSQVIQNKKDPNRPIRRVAGTGMYGGVDIGPFRLKLELNATAR